MRCLDLCPTAAVTPAGDHVAIDPFICAGCGQCAAACPTGAAAYALPLADVLMRTLLTTYRETGGEDRVPGRGVAGEVLRQCPAGPGRINSPWLAS